MKTFKDKKEKDKFMDDMFKIINRIRGMTAIDYEFTIVIEKELKDSGAHTTEDESIWGCISINTHYHTASLTLSPVAVEEWRRDGPKELIYHLCHEIAHVIIEPVRELIFEPFKSKNEVSKETEYATQKVSGIMFDLYNKLHSQEKKITINKKKKHAKRNIQT